MRGEHMEKFTIFTNIYILDFTKLEHNSDIYEGTMI
jgi:hypothetical protein